MKKSMSSDVIESTRFGKILLVDDGYHTNAYSIYRWNSLMVDRPGTYRVIGSWPSMEFARMAVSDGQYEHPTCVVDDFGSLVRVAA